MTRRDLRAAAIAAGVGLAVIVLLAGIGLIERANMVTSGGGPPRDGDLVSIPTTAPVVPDANGNVMCLDALDAGRLVADPRWGIAVQAGVNPPDLIFWPHGYVGRVAGDRLELLNDRGQVIAHTGDHIEMGGGMTTIGGREGFSPCPVGIEVIPSGH